MGAVSWPGSICASGSRVYIEGQLQTRKWTDADGRDRYATEIILTAGSGEMILLDSRADSREPGPVEAANNAVPDPVGTRATS
ncbi:single-stranded DNA-binding protein [Haematospirillum jordaniae]|nr:single-stranded DNA-binding protein [Haematospirillum jordaniae]NKD58146.1 single-stranded DNA-binding protein [Haematospirillum jordaniae]NKD60255.1 single-stranded DNA-binding protein [Haematospirillum jordaniae]NKD68188.1 single-stranded DNA-binding protein [Haematospirillum jordaniae]NKD80219.1 single-stranded DNA-binding protein [Haematospirillum jordaniae]